MSKEKRTTRASGISGRNMLGACGQKAPSGARPWAAKHLHLHRVPPSFIAADVGHLLDRLYQTETALPDIALPLEVGNVDLFLVDRRGRGAAADCDWGGGGGRKSAEE